MMRVGVRVRVRVRLRVRVRVRLEQDSPSATMRGSNTRSTASIRGTPSLSNPALRARVRAQVGHWD